MPEAAEPGRARTDPDGDDRQVAETLCAGGAAGGSKGSSGLLQSGLAAEACAVSEGDAQRSTSWCPSSSKSSSVTGAGGDRSWSGGTARVPGELVATSTDETGCPGGIAIRLGKAEHQTVPQAGGKVFVEGNLNSCARFCSYVAIPESCLAQARTDNTAQRPASKLLAYVPQALFVPLR